jgi:SprB repeat
MIYSNLHINYFNAMIFFVINNPTFQIKHILLFCCIIGWNLGTNPLKAQCSFTSAGLSSPIANNNSTPTGADDRIMFSLNPTGTNLGSSYTVSVNNGGTITPTSASYGAATTFLLQTGSANGATSYTITISNATGSVCNTTTTVGPIAASPYTCPSPMSLCAGDSYTLTVQAGLSNYQWYLDTGSGAVAIAGANSNIYSNANQAGTYTWTAEYGTCSVSTCCPIILQANNVTASVISGNQTICANADPTAFTVGTAATGTGTLSYQWRSSTTSCATGFTDIAGAISATYDSPAGLTQTTYYQLVITSTLNGTGCTATSNCLTVTVNPLPTFTTTATNVTCNGMNNGLITINASGNAPFQYSLNDGSTFTAAQTNPNLAPSNYQPAVKDANGCVKKCN